MSGRVHITVWCRTNERTLGTNGIEKGSHVFHIRTSYPDRYAISNFTLDSHEVICCNQHGYIASYTQALKLYRMPELRLSNNNTLHFSFQS